MSLNIFIAGQKSFGAHVYKAVREAGHIIVGVACPDTGKYYDRLKKEAYCDPSRPLIIDSEKLLSADIPDNIDILIAAHSHHYISGKVREKVKYAIGYHPSLLPLHRGRDAVKWTIHCRDPIAGGTVYILNDKVDGGPIICQESVIVRRGWNASELWKEVLFPMGIRLILNTITQIERGEIKPMNQDERGATWEPPFEHRRLHRPELLRIE